MGPLLYACEAGDAALARTLLTAKAVVDLANKDGGTALVDACRSGQAEIAQLLLGAHAAVDRFDAHGGTALKYANIR